MDTKITDNVDLGIQAALLEGLKQYNSKFIMRDIKDYSIGIENKGILIAGAVGNSSWDWLFVRLLWVDENHRGTGLGTKVMDSIHGVALSRKCIGIYLNTFSFQALGFYEKQGFSVFGVIEDHPIGHKRYYMAKRIA